MTRINYPSDLPGISLDKDWGSGMMDKGLNGYYVEPCKRALNIAKTIVNKPELLDIAWVAGRVQRRNIEEDLRIAALTLWLARGREVFKGNDGLIRAKGTVLIKPIEKLLELIEQVEQVIKDANV